MPKGGQYLWSASYICRILKNPVYTGTFVYGKYKTPAVGEKKRLRQEKDWIRIPNHHEPIIERELFEQAQKSRAHGKRKTDGISHFLTGKVLCAGCKRNLRFRKTAEPYFCCQSRTGRAGTACVRKLPVSHLENVLLQELIRMKREQKLPVRAWCDSRKRMLAEEEELQQKQLQKQKHRLGRYRRQLFEAYLQKEPVSVADPCIQSCMQEIRMCTQQIRQIQNSRQQLQMWQEQEIFPPDGVLKQQFLDRFLDHISVQADGTIHIFWKPYQENKVSGEPEIPEALDDGCIRKTFL